MKISVSKAKTHLTELVHRAEAGEEIVLTRLGQPVARLLPTVVARNRKARLAALEAMCQAAPTRVSIGPGAAQSRDSLVGPDGLPEWARDIRK